jgi:tRNA(Ile)-lysidine synthase
MQKPTPSASVSRQNPPAVKPRQTSSNPVKPKIFPQLLPHIAQSIRDHRLFHPRQPIMIAVSGGLDSMVLLHVLHSLSAQHHWRLCVAHFNHQLRGRSSDADERLVRRTAKTWKLPIVVERANVRRFARNSGLSLEMAARKLRHDFLARAALRRRIRTIALAHHADDQIELFFLRLLRGSGGEGLAGMKWRNPSPANPTLELVRPLLDQPKSTLRQFAVEQGIPFREDATNTSLDILRNRLRHELLPLLKRHYQPGLDKALLRTMDIVGAEADLASQLARDWLKHHKPLASSTPSVTTKTTRPAPVPLASSARFGDLPLAVQRRCLFLQLLNMDVLPDFDLIEHLRRNVGQASRLPPVASGGASLAVMRDTRGKLSLIRPQASPVPAFRAQSLWLDLQTKPNQVVFGQNRVSWRTFRPSSPGIPPRRSGRELFDADRVGSPVLLRHWQPGDKFQPIGMPAPIKLQDLFTNQKVSRHRRHELLVATTAAGELFWVQDLRISERFKLTNASIRCLQWAWQPL